MAQLSIVLLVIFLGNVLGHTNNREGAEVLIRLTVLYFVCRLVWNTWTQRTFYIAAIATLLGLLLGGAKSEFGHMLDLAGPAVGILASLVMYSVHVHEQRRKKGQTLFTTFSRKDNAKPSEKGRILN